MMKSVTLYIENEKIWDTIPAIVGAPLDSISDLVVEVYYRQDEIIPATWYDPEEGGDIELVAVEVLGYHGEVVDINNVGKVIEVTAEQAAAITAKLGDDLEAWVLEQLE